MIKRRKKKNVKQRGSGSHGWGSKKSHRASGRRGGAGFSGTGKRADQIKTLIWGRKNFFGKHGFTKHPKRVELKAVNISYIEKNFENLMRDERIEKRGNKYYIELSNLGFGKLLSQGIVKHSFIIKCQKTSKRAAEKIRAAGGEIIEENRKQKSAEDEKIKRENNIENETENLKNVNKL